jgi:hypothetical protein
LRPIAPLAGGLLWGQPAALASGPAALIVAAGVVACLASLFALGRSDEP